MKLPFLDFTPLAERERTARRELELNAPHAPGLYRDVIPVTRGSDAPAEGGLRLGGEGEVVDWVLRMAPVPPDDFLDHRADRLDDNLLDRIADAVAAMHARLPRAPRDQVPRDQVPRDQVRRDQIGGFDWLTAGNRISALTAGIDAVRVEAWCAAMRAGLAGIAGWLRAREAAGFVRRIHGDLHLGNICLWRGHPVPFDALEFNEAMATFDTGYDLAFLLMDLDLRAGRRAANRVMNRYLARTGDVGLLRGLPVFLSMRAMVRAHVAARSNDPAGSARYLAAAEAYLLPPRPVVMAIGGLQGTGKSTLARRLAPDLGPAPGAAILRSDEIRKALLGVAPEDPLPQSAYRPAVGREVFDTLARYAAIAASAGHAVIADAMFFNTTLREAIAQAAGDVPFHGFWLTAPMDVLEARIAARVGDASDADVEVLRRAARGDPGAGSWHVIDAGTGDDPVAQVRLIMRHNNPI